MNFLALVLLLLGALAVLISAPFALFMPYRTMDDTDHPVWRYLSVAIFVVIPLLLGFCVFQGWQAFQVSDYILTVKYAAFPAFSLLIGGGVIAIATTLVKKTERFNPKNESPNSNTERRAR